MSKDNPKTAGSRIQVNVLITEQLASQIDAKRIELQRSQGSIPTRSEVVRLALEQFLSRPEQGSRR